MKQDDGEFVYCLPRERKNKRARYDPFDLQVVSPNESRSAKIYWTISASFVTRVSKTEIIRKYMALLIKCYHDILHRSFNPCNAE